MYDVQFTSIQYRCIILLQKSRFITSWSVRVSLGYEGDGFVCTDVNECLINNGGCSLNPRVQCVNNRVCEFCLYHNI